MALAPPPPWTSFTPLDFVNAASSGARLGLEQAGQINAANEAADRLRLGYAQLAAENARAGMAAAAQEREARAADALRQMGLQSKMAQNDALNQYRSSRLGDFQEGLDLRKAQQDAALKKSVGIENDASGFLKELTSGSEASDALKKYPLAGHDPTIRSLITQGEIAKRTDKTQSAITDRAKLRGEQRNTQFRLSDLSRHIGRLESALNNPNLELDDITKQQMQAELKGLKDEKAGLMKELSPTVGGSGNPTNPDDPLGILGPTAIPADSETPPDE